MCVYVYVGVQTHIHSSDVVLIGLSDLLHDLDLGQSAGFNRAFDCDGSLWVVQGQILKTAHNQRGVVTDA